MKKLESCALLVGMYNAATAMETVCCFSKKLKIELPYDSAIPLLGIYPKELKAGF